MLDLKFIRDNLEAVQASIEARNVQADAELVARTYDERNALLKELEHLRAQRNDNAKKMKAAPNEQTRAALIEEGKRLKTTIPDLEKKLETLEQTLYSEAAKVPNMVHPEAPVGADEGANRELKQVGGIPDFTFPTRDHIAIGEQLGLLDFERGTKVSETKFYYLKNQAVLLELGLVRFALDHLARKGFHLMLTPDIARESIVDGIGFNPRGPESNLYTLEDEGTCLVGTAEITLGGYYANEILAAEELPILMAGVSHCFRREAGAAGQFSKGLYRVHQFTKVEMFVICTPETSEQEHERLREIEEELFSNLEIPYRVVDTATGDLGAPAYRKYDLEAWMPGRGENGDWGEITSASNCTDYQARRLHVRYKSAEGNRHVHMLNGTAIAVSRAIIALLENYQQADGSVRMPRALVPYVGFKQIGPADG